MFTQLKFVRLGQGIKLMDLAKKAKISPSLLSKIENGKFKGSEKARARIAEIFDVAPEILFGK